MAEERTANDGSPSPSKSLDQLLERRADLVLEPVGELLLDDPAADLLAGLGQGPGVVGVEVLDPLRDPVTQDCPVPGLRKRWKASAVVAKPSGTLTPRSVRLETISPSEAFLPPTWSRSSIPRSENHRTLGCSLVHVCSFCRFFCRSPDSVCMITVEISSTDRAEVSTTGIRWAPYSCLARRSSQRHCSTEAYFDAGPPLAAHPAQPVDGGGQPEAAVAVVAHRSRQVLVIEVLVDQRVVRDEQPVLQGEVHARGRLAAPRRRQQDHVGLLHGPRALTVVVLDGELHRRHPVVVALDVTHAVQAGGLVDAALAEDLLDPRHVQLEEVDDRRPRLGQLLAHVVDGRGGEDERRHGPVHRLVEHRHHPTGVLHRGDERDQRALEEQVRELDEQRVAHRLRADAGAVD